MEYQSFPSSFLLFLTVAAAAGSGNAKPVPGLERFFLETHVWQVAENHSESFDRLRTSGKRLETRENIRAC
jgi:hypothetical protein